MDNNQIYEACYDEGQQAFKDGVSLDDNPYSYLQQGYHHFSWADGWHDAEFDAEDDWEGFDA